VNRINRLGVGFYEVTMPNLGQSNGNVQVTSYGTTVVRCKVQAWVPQGTTQRIWVRCFTPLGRAADAMFVAQYFRAGVTATPSAYLWAHSPTAAAYVPSRLYSHNSAGGTNTVRRVSAGVYVATLPGITRIGGNVHVTAYGATSQYCKVSNWAAGTSVVVRCFSSRGGAVDSMFSLRYTDRSVANAGGKGAYVWANNATSPLYAPSSFYRFHSQGAIITAGRTGLGTYRVNLPVLPAFNRTSTMVTGYGTTNTSCNVVSWLASGTATRATVQCRNGVGGLTNSQFTLSYLTNR
jgi:hypothetical protein